jgi:hypothetical protein
VSHILDIPFNGGYVSTGTGARDSASLESGELAKMEAAYYRKNDPTQVWKMPGRALFGSAGSTAVKGLAICQFDDGGTDKLVASIGTTLVAATPGATGTFASLATGLHASATRFTACHQDDRWYLGNGYDANKCLKPDGTVRLMGMAGPQVALTASAASSAGVIAYPTVTSGAFLNPTLAYDGNNGTYSSGTLSAAGTVTETWKTWGADLTATRWLQVRWSLSGLPISGDSDTGGGASIGTGGTVDAGYNVTILLEKAETVDGSGNPVFSTMFTATRNNATSGVQTHNFLIGDTHNSSAVQFRARLTYNSGTSAATLRIYEVKTQYGSTVTAFTTTGSMYYTYTEYDSTEDNGTSRSGEGPPAELTELAEFTVAKNLVTLTRGAVVNPAATHWKIYRTVPGAAGTIDSLGFLKMVEISTFVAYDFFETDATIQLTPTVAAMSIGDLPIPRDTPPPAFISMISWKGSVVGISRTNRRVLRYSEAGLPESFPEFYVVSSFPIDEHDGLVGQMAVGETLVLLMEGAVLALDDLPRVVDGQFNGASARPLKGHPGCVGEYAYTAWSVAGEPRGAWVSPFGVYVTNGQVCACISTDLAWENEVNVPFLANSVLRWDQKNLILWFEFDLDGDGLNDHEMPFHMAQTHSKGEARPKLGQPTTKATSCMASSLISSTHYRFSGHPSNGGVYVEESGYTDAATGSNVAMVVKSGQIAKDKVDLAVVKATVNHSDFGTGETGTLTATLYRDVSNTENSRAQSVRLDGNRGTTVGIGRAGELVDVQVAYSGVADGGIGGVTLEIDGQGRSGSAARWASASATP